VVLRETAQIYVLEIEIDNCYKRKAINQIENGNPDKKNRRQEFASSQAEKISLEHLQQQR
jgi:hypothetical protein